MFLEDIIGDPKPQSGAGAIALGGEEGVEDAGEVFGRDAAAAVGDGDAHTGLMGAGVIAGLLDADVNVAMSAGGVDGVGEQVGEGLAHLTAHGEHVATASRAEVEADFTLLNLVMVEIEQAPEGLLEINRGGD